eukprot:scaffold13785_cov30-Tisochrysis_lutea.AAC.2
MPEAPMHERIEQICAFESGLKVHVEEDVAASLNRAPENTLPRFAVIEFKTGAGLDLALALLSLLESSVGVTLAPTSLSAAGVGPAVIWSTHDVVVTAGGARARSSLPRGVSGAAVTQ